MIRPEDFEIDIGYDSSGTNVRVVHRPTGRVRVATGVRQVGRTRDALVAELRGLLWAPTDFRIDHQCGPLSEA